MVKRWKGPWGPNLPKLTLPDSIVKKVANLLDKSQGNAILVVIRIIENPVSKYNGDSLCIYQLCQLSVQVYMFSACLQV